MDTLQHYPKETAGHRMTSAVPVVLETETLQEIHDALRTSGARLKTINYIYVLSHEKKLIGVLSVRELFTEKLERKVGDVCKKSPLIFVHPETHQERAAYLALQHNIKAIPVVDKKQQFLGEITADSIQSILYKEMHEDSFLRAGIRHSAHAGTNIFSLTLLQSLRHRVPWLLLGLFGGLITAKIIGGFEETLSENILLAAFIPLVVYMSSAVGMQMEAYVVRDTAFEKSIPFSSYLLKHSVVVLCIAFMMSVVLGVLLFFFYKGSTIALAVSIALFLSVLSSILTGLLLPYALFRFNLDPADAGGPIGTIFQDMISILIYFSVAVQLL